MSAEESSPGTPAPAPPGPSPRRRVGRSLLTLAGVAGALLVAQQARAALGIEWSADSIRETVRDAGIWAPVFYLCLTAGRQLFVLPSVIMLTAAGLLFGVGTGTALGGLGMTLNALVLYGLARGTGRHWVQPWLKKSWPRLDAQARAAGPALVALMTGHPAGVLTPFHLAAGATGMRMPIFLVAVFPAALFRAALYALLGAHLLDVDSAGFWVATVGLSVCAVAPLFHAGLRRRLFAMPDA